MSETNQPQLGWRVVNSITRWPKSRVYAEEDKAAGLCERLNRATQTRGVGEHYSVVRAPLIQSISGLTSLTTSHKISHRRHTTGPEQAP